MIHICDAIMGSGKSQSAISYINAHPEKRFIYITPYTDEATRIAESCPGHHFVEPSDKDPRYEHSKVQHTVHLIANGMNVASTHAAFCLYRQDMIENIRRYEYTLIVDEAVNILTEMKEPYGDLRLLENAGCIVNNGDGAYSLGSVPYDGNGLKRLYNMCMRNNVLCLYNDGDEVGSANDATFYWELLPDVMRAFSEVFILTYLFGGQDICAYLNKFGMEYDFIGVRRTGDCYEFAPTMEYYPEYIGRLDEMIHICENDRMNSVGNSRTALSTGWYERHSANCPEIEAVRKNMVNFLRFIHKGNSSERMWSCQTDHKCKIKDKGLGAYVPLNKCATNEYSKCKYLAYPVNIFANPFKKRYLQKLCSHYEEDMFSLSVMIQWIWRSAIRNGEEIYLYLPSSRMRGLLKDWIARTQAEYRARTEGGEQA